MWHVDGFDKLKPYAFAVHGCVDGCVVGIHDALVVLHSNVLIILPDFLGESCR